MATNMKSRLRANYANNNPSKKAPDSGENFVDGVLDKLDSTDTTDKIDNPVVNTSKPENTTSATAAVLTEPQNSVSNIHPQTNADHEHDAEEYSLRTYNISIGSAKYIKRKAAVNRSSIKAIMNHLLDTGFTLLEKEIGDQTVLNDADYDKMEDYAQSIKGRKEVLCFSISKANIEKLEHYSALFATKLSIFMNYMIDTYKNVI